MNTIIDSLNQFWGFTGFANMTWQHIAIICIGAFFIVLAIKKDWEPLLLIPIGFGIIIGNIPFAEGYQIGIYEEGSVMNILYQGVRNGWYPPLIFLGIGAMTDFSSLISQPRLMLIGAAAQIGIFGAYAIALCRNFDGCCGVCHRRRTAGSAGKSRDGKLPHGQQGDRHEPAPLLLLLGSCGRGAAEHAVFQAPWDWQLEVDCGVLGADPGC